MATRRVSVFGSRGVCVDVGGWRVLLVVGGLLLVRLLGGGVDRLLGG